MLSPQPDLVNRCGGFTKAVALVATASRALWTLAAGANPEDPGTSKRDPYRHTSIEELTKQCELLANDVSSDQVNDLVSHMARCKLCWSEGKKITYRISVHNPVALVRQLLEGARPDHDLRYFTWRNIRRHYRFVQSAELAHHVHAMAGLLNELILSRRQEIDASPVPSRGMNWSLDDEVMPLLLRKRGEDLKMPPRMIDFFLECCRAVNYVRVSDRIGRLDIRAQEIDPEFLLGQLFGIPTSIRGLDDLFGGGGLMLTECEGAKGQLQLGGRAVLSIGPFGSGKSLLALQVAAEVARKGGAAWLMPMEQSTEECLYALETMGCLPEGGPIRLATTVPQAIEVLDVDHFDPERGALILLRTIKESFTDFAVAFEGNAKAISMYPLRLLIVDPVSSILRQEESTNLRSEMASLFESVKRTGTNIWLVAEEGGQSPTSIEQAISDTVLHLGSERIHGYTQRYLEITKSRLQREQRGVHAFTIGPGGAFTVYPSPSAVRSKLQKRSVRKPEHGIKFGFSVIDSLLQSENLFSGDVIALQGPSGSGKSSAALNFLLSADLPRTSGTEDSTLLLTNVESVGSLRFQLGLMYRELRSTSNFSRQPCNVNIIGLPGGYVKPGYILQRLELELENSTIHRIPIARVVVENIVNLEVGCPFVAGDQTFGDTLVDLMRKHGVTSLFVCRDEMGKEGACLQQSILNNADCLIQFSLRDSKSYVEVKKSRGTHHQRGAVPVASTTDATTMLPERARAKPTKLRRHVSIPPRGRKRS
jgi:KaiC/GvpD/RAD55 family RecA-like ATPase